MGFENQDQVREKNNSKYWNIVGDTKIYVEFTEYPGGGGER